MYRVEDKFFSSEDEMLFLESKLAMVLPSDKYSKDSKYRVTSLYFDDYWDSNLRESEDGIACRKKYRIRMYNGDTSFIRLEVKYKAYNRVYKKSSAISLDECRALMRGQCIQDDYDSFDSARTLFNIGIMEGMLKPKVIVEYDRNAYVYNAGNVRITFDRNIRSSNQIDRFLSQDYNTTMVREVNRILEVKYDEFLPTFIGQLLESGNMNQIAYSKYRLCRENEED